MTPQPRPVLLAACLIPIVSACVQGPDYVTPQVAVPGSYRYAATDPALDPGLSQDNWWDQFGDPYLNVHVQQALASNRQLAVATARVDEFAAILAGTRSQARPQIGYGLSGNRTRTSEEKLPPIVDPFSTTWTSVLSANWELDLWGRIRRETEAARANLLASEEARLGVTLTVISSVIAGYVTLLDLDEQLRVTDATIAGRGRSVGLFETRLSGGWISEFEMSQVRAEYEAALTQRPAILEAIAVQEHALSVLLGRNPGPVRRAASLDALRTPRVPPGLPSELLIRRPDIRQAEQQLVASNALIGAARALFFPRISLTGLFGFASGSLGSLFSGPAHTWSFTGDAAGPIYTGGGLQAAVDQAEARRDQQLANYELVIQDAFRDVEDALATLKYRLEQLEILTRRVETLERSVSLATERYENGYADYIDVLDAERSLFSAQLQLASARGDYNRAAVDLYRALGGSWSAPASMNATSLSSGGTSHE